MNRTLGYACLAMCLAGCAGSLDPNKFGDGGGASSCGDVLATIITPTCAYAGCHSNVAPQGSLDLQTVPVGSRLVNKMASGGPGLLIDPTTPKDSVMYTKTLNPPPFGTRMPSGGALSSKQEACLLTWISSQTDDAGASTPDDGGVTDMAQSD